MFDNLRVTSHAEGDIRLAPKGQCVVVMTTLIGNCSGETIWKLTQQQQQHHQHQRHAVVWTVSGLFARSILSHFHPVMKIDRRPIPLNFGANYALRCTFMPRNG